MFDHRVVGGLLSHESSLSCAEYKWDGNDWIWTDDTGGGGGDGDSVQDAGGGRGGRGRGGGGQNKFSGAGRNVSAAFQIRSLNLGKRNALGLCRFWKCKAPTPTQT